jgi:hypothetical protein
MQVKCIQHDLRVKTGHRTSACSPTGTVDKELGTGREVIVDDVIQEWDVNATCSNICDN